MYFVHISAHLLLCACCTLGYILHGMSPDLFLFQCFIILGLLHFHINFGVSLFVYLFVFQQKMLANF